jgi:hypothetical protein
MARARRKIADRFDSGDNSCYRRPPERANEYVVGENVQFLLYIAVAVRAGAKLAIETSETNCVRQFNGAAAIARRA